MSLRDNLLLMFFTTVGLSADARMLVKGGPKLFVFLAISAAFIVVQNAVGIAAALAMDLHPVVGLLGGSVTLTGGHGTGAAYGGRFGETMNLAGAMELTMACATAGLVLGSVLGGPLAEYLGPAVPAGAGDRGTPARRRRPTARREADAITSQSVLNTLFAILACLAGGKMLARLVSGHRHHPARFPVLPAARRGHPQRRDVRFPASASAAPPSTCSAASRCRCFSSWR